MNFRLSVLCVILLASSAAVAQDYKLFRFGAGMGLAAPQKQAIPGYLIYFEPALRIRNNLAIGVRVETLGMPSGDIGILGSYSINGQYYFTRGQVQFFGGIGVGVFTPNRGVLAKCYCENELMPNVFGFYPRLGLDYNHMTLTLEYNAVNKAKQVKYNDPPLIPNSPTYYDAQTSYFSLKFGFFLGGGKKNDD